MVPHTPSALLPFMGGGIVRDCSWNTTTSTVDLTFVLESCMGMGTTVLPRLQPRYYRGCNRGYGVKFYDKHRGNCGVGDSIHGSTAGAVTALTVKPRWRWRNVNARMRKCKCKLKITKMDITELVFSLTWSYFAHLFINVCMKFSVLNQY